jgi:hypothetical protein
MASCEPGEMCSLLEEVVTAETAVIRFTTHGPSNKLVLEFEYCTSMVTHCHGSVSQELQFAVWYCKC